MDKNSRDILPRQCVTQLGYLGIGVSDLDAWKDFANHVLGLQESGTGPDGSVYFRIDGYHHRFQLFPSGEDDLLFAGWEVKDAEALRRIAVQVRELGCEVTEATASEAAARNVVGLVRFNDPDGLAVEVYYGPFRATEAFRSPRGALGFKGEELGLGHIVVGVDDPDATLQFYMSGLGVKLSDYIFVERGGARQSLVFTHVNPRHHSMAVFRRSTTASSSRDMKRLSHFMVEVLSLDDIGEAIDIAKAKGVPARTLGKHTNDRMVSIYLRSPSGFTIEYGFAGLLIENEDTWNVRHYNTTSVWGHQWNE